MILHSIHTLELPPDTGKEFRDKRASKKQQKRNRFQSSGGMSSHERESGQGWVRGSDRRGGQNLFSLPHSSHSSIFRTALGIPLFPTGDDVLSNLESFWAKERSVNPRELPENTQSQ